jgi:hypothetical protein
VGRGGESPAKVPRPTAGSAPFKRPTEEALKEEGADGVSNPPTWVEGTAAVRHAVMPPCPEPYRRGARVSGGSAWTPGGSCMAGWKGDAPLMGNMDPRAWLLVPLGATPIPLGPIFRIGPLMCMHSGPHHLP